MDYLSSFRLLLGHAGGARRAIVLSMLLATLAAAFELVPLYIVWRVVVSVIEGTVSLSSVLSSAGLAAGVVLLGHAAQAAAVAKGHAAAFGVIRNLRLAVAAHLSRLPLGWLSARTGGEAKALVIDEPERLEMIAAHGIPEGTGAVVTWLAVSAWLFAVDWRMALASVFLTPLSFLLIGIAMLRSARKVPAFQGASARMNAAVVEYVAGMPVVKIFNRSGESLAGAAAAVRDYVRIETEITRAYVPLGGAFNALVLANITLILPAGLWLMAAGTLDVATFVFFVILGAGYSLPLMKLFTLFQHLAQISVASRAVEDLLATPAQPESACRVAFSSRDVVFDNVSFAYGERMVLRDVSFTARAGVVTALVGPSGSGKSTAATLVARFNDVAAGRITLGGVDLRDIPTAQLMDEIAFVFQDVFLFSDTIAANIAIARPGASRQEVRAAARAAQADGFISALPQGYDTAIGSRGVQLSGGERQRIAIARAILKDASIIVLDEATAFADPDSEAAIQAGISALAQGRTLIVVAHRLHTIAAASEIVVLSEGRVAERGGHDALLHRRGLYADLWADWEAVRSAAFTGENRMPEAAQ
ncbi:ABC transporter ATP-binding protein (plasmid) [Shinella yambaruensis]|uniref:ABC transporter ATP-binding protein n=1 Tax=Shinella yambaruensis TaxID=415996 RepID=UPI003D7B2C81